MALHCVDRPSELCSVDISERKLESVGLMACHSLHLFGIHICTVVTHSFFLYVKHHHQIKKKLAFLIFVFFDLINLSLDRLHLKVWRNLTVLLM